MNHEKYNNIIASDDFLEYEFISVGPKGRIPKIIQFKITNNPNVYNLAFGNKNENGDLDDLATNNNNDRNKILTTVVLSVYLFTSEYPTKWVFFSGSTPDRTRLYRMAIALNFEELSFDFEIYGILRGVDSYVTVPFQKEVNYYGFLIKRKTI